MRCFPHKSVLITFADAAILSCLLLVQSCSHSVVPVTQTRDLPYAFWTLTINDHAEETNFVACFERIEKILHEFNMYSTDSETPR